ncbi:MAG: phage holin family protein [Rhodocyclaceae bacterium]|jgi:uncharacterized membrane protein YqjE
MTGELSARARRLGAHVLALGTAHLRLAGIEWQEEVGRQLRVLIWVAVGLISGGLTILLVTLSVVAFFWDTPHRVSAVLLLAAFFLVVCVVIAFTLSNRLRNAPIPFSALIEELRRDGELLSGETHDQLMTEEPLVQPPLREQQP